jgi:hypothetical protein
VASDHQVAGSNPARRANLSGALVTEPRESAIWTLVWRAGYLVLRILDPLLRATWRFGGLGITANLTVSGRRSSRRRSVLVGLLRVGDRWYVGHPSGDVDWTRNLAAAGEATIQPWARSPVEVRGERLNPGPERSEAIRAAGEQQPFPANLLYRASRRHTLAVGVYFRLEPIRR